jgi:hypothetical protein
MTRSEPPFVAVALENGLMGRTTDQAVTCAKNGSYRVVDEVSAANE